MGLLSTVLLLVAFAWLVRALLSAHQVTWPRTLAAAAIGSAVGAAIAALLLIAPTDLTDAALLDERRGELLLLALPFQLVATMLAVVAFELVAARPRRVEPWRPRSPLRSLRRRVAVLRRAVEIARITSRHGLAPLVGLRRGAVDVRSPEELARRARSALEDAGGMFIKLGQLLASRPDLLPPEVVEELGRLHAAVRPLPTEQVVAALSEELGAAPEQVFASFEPQPLGAASIAQVHAARLRDGTEVVCKLRRPGLEEVVERDLAIVAWLARVAERRTVWARVYGARDLAAGFATALREELDLALEGRRATEIAGAVAHEPRLVVPRIIDEHSTARLLVMQRLHGRPLSELTTALPPEDARGIADLLCASQVDAMLTGARFHADPHPGNVLHLDDGRVGLIDLGATGRLDAFERDSMLQLLVALGLQQPTLLVEALLAAGAVRPGTDRDRLERELARFLAVHLGPGLPTTRTLTDLLRLLSELGIRLPAQATTMLRALATLAGTLEHLVPGYPVIEQVAARGGEEVTSRVAPGNVRDLLQQEWVQLGPVLRRAPRHLDRIATQLEHGGLTTRVRLFADERDVRVVERLVHRVVLSIIALGTGLLSVLLLGTTEGPVFAGGQIRLVAALGWTGLFASIVLLLRVLLSVLRAEAEGP